MKHLTYHFTLAISCIALTTTLAGCSEKPQAAGTTHTTSSHAWKGGEKGFAAPGWQTGEKSSWEEHIKQRNRNQNEYTRMGM